MSRFRRAGRTTSPGTLSPSPDPALRPAVQRRRGAAPDGDPSFLVADALRNPGRPLDSSIRDSVERRLGFDFGRVRIHTDESAAASARALHAHAYTLGPHIVFGRGGYAPDTEAGRHRLHHELSHVMQQRPGSPMPDGPLELGSADSAHERQARRMASAASPAEVQGVRSGIGPLHPAVIARDPVPGAPEPAQEAPPAPPSPEIAEQQARNAFPNHPRGAALRKKQILGTITKPEISELRGIMTFPENPRGALLHAKQDGGTITPAEQEELRGYLSRREASRVRESGPASLGGPRENPRAAALRAKQAAGPLTREEQAELQGLNGYPDNPRAAALSAKRILGTMTKEERAELQGFDTYPFNRRAAAILTRILLGQAVTNDEKFDMYEESADMALGEFLLRLERRIREGRTRSPSDLSDYNSLRRYPKVVRRAEQIRQAGGPPSSVLED